VILLCCTVVYAVVGCAYLWAYNRGWVEGFAEPCWDREGAFCELLWCWCVPAYWRASDEACLAAFEGRSDGPASPSRAITTTAPLLGTDSEESDSD